MNQRCIIVILITTFCFITLITTYPLKTEYIFELKDDLGTAIDITSQGDHTYIVRSDFKLYKYNLTTKTFVFFQGPQESSVDLLIRAVTVDGIGEVRVCAGNYNKEYEFITSWAITGYTNLCYETKRGYLANSFVYRKAGIGSNDIYAFKIGGSYILYYSGIFSFSADETSKIKIILYNSIIN